jgi:hypothetical protein
MSGFNIDKLMATLGWLIVIIAGFSGYLSVGIRLLLNENYIFGMGWLSIPTVIGLGWTIYDGLPDEKKPASKSDANHEYEGEEGGDGW